eukprot:3070018-Rhodomonas_salina.3
MTGSQTGKCSGDRRVHIHVAHRHTWYGLVLSGFACPAAHLSHHPLARRLMTGFKHKQDTHAALAACTASRGW